MGFIKKEKHQSSVFDGKSKDELFSMYMVSIGLYKDNMDGTFSMSGEHKSKSEIVDGFRLWKEKNNIT